MAARRPYIPRDTFEAAKNAAYQCGQNGEDRAAFDAKIAQISHYLVGDPTIFESYNKGRNARAKSNDPRNQEYCYRYRFDSRRKIYRDAKFQPFAVSASSPAAPTLPLHPNALAGLRPSTRWTVLVDETGANFDVTAFSSAKERGKIVALFIPQESETALAPLSNAWRAVEQNFDAIERVVDVLLASECGVLGVSVDSLNAINGEHWLYGIETLLSFGLRLLPLDGETTVDVRVERRGDFKSNERKNDDKNAAKEAEFWNKYLQIRLDGVQAELARSFPEKAEKIRLTGRFIAKSDDPRNGYVDAAAFVWGGSSVVGLLAKSGWPNACFLEGDSQKLRSAFDLALREARLAPDDWAELVDSDAATQANSLVAATLRNVGETTRKDVARWRDYLNRATSTIDSKAIRLHALRRQIAWLKEYAPQDDLPPKLELLWLTDKIATENHCGAVATPETVEQYKRCRQLAKKLYEEDAPLACNAELHIAVSAANAFDFRKPQEILATWADRDPAIVGLRLRGQILSSLGQFQAFNGDQAKAIDYFKEAIETFKKLSDPFESALEISQTSAYLFIAATDLRPFSAQEFQNAASLYFQTSTLAEAAEKLRGTNDASEKYRCAVLLRALAYLDAPSVQAEPTLKRDLEEAKATYFRRPSDWKTDVGHPWEFVEFYRGVLSSSEAERSERFRSAYQLASVEGGATLRVIAAVILGSLLTLSSATKKDRDEYDELLRQIERDLPTLKQTSGAPGGMSRLTVLKNQPSHKLPPLELAKLVLPFNFR